jgi:LCP family protein required for cell wall assembly
MRKLFLISAGVLSLLLAGGSGVAIYAINYVDSRLPAVCSGSKCKGENDLRSVRPNQECERTSCNFLLLGSDSRKGLSEKEQQAIGTGPDAVQGQRADTVVVVNVNPTLNRTTVLHIPRDLLVDIPGHGENKINSAFEHGPNTMVRTVEKLTGLSINHYVQVNFAGFEGLVDALGGVEICVDRPLIDPLAGLRLRHAGCHDMDGRTSLAFVRARHVEGDAIPDFARIARQQQFMRAIIDQLLSAGAVTKFRELIAAIQDNLVLDDGLNLYSLQDLTRKLSGLGEGGVLFRAVPSTPQTINGVDYVVATPLARRLFHALRKGKPLGDIGKGQARTELSPAAVTVRVYDGGGPALQVAEYLRHAGFAVLSVASAPTNLTESAIYYRGTTIDERRVLASYLPDWSSRRDSTVIDASGADVVVVVAGDSAGVPR